MPYYVAPFTFDFSALMIDVDSGAVDIDCQSLYGACKLAQASVEGIIYERIAAGSGLNTLGPGVQVGITVELLGDWQLRFPAGNYVARVAGGNLIGGSGGDPIAYTPGVQTLLIQSAASTVVTEGGSAATPSEIADGILQRNLAGGADGGRTVRDALRVGRNRVSIVGNTLTVYAEDDTTVAWTAALTTGPRDPLSQVDPT
jgi:hypothetical protein